MLVHGRTLDGERPTMSPDGVRSSPRRTGPSLGFPIEPLQMKLSSSAGVAWASKPSRLGLQSTAASDGQLANDQSDL